MRFISIHQYFNKLQIVFLGLMIVPLLAFMTGYMIGGKSPLVPEQPGVCIAIPLLALLGWVFAIVTFNKKIKSARNGQGLGAKLDKYFTITIVRYCFVSLAGIILALGFLLTPADVFTALYLAHLAVSGLLWPTGPRVSRELMLRGDEREMVYFKKDSF